MLKPSPPAHCPVCLEEALSGLSENGLSNKEYQTGHKFDTGYDKQLTFRYYMRNRYEIVMDVTKVMEQELGKEKSIRLLKKYSSDRLFLRGKSQAEEYGSNYLNSYVEQFRGGYEYTLTKEVVKDTDRCFKLNVTEYIWASTFRERNMGDYGYAIVCWADYAWAEGFNPKIKLIRDKTLMQGDSCCNHKYVI